MSTTTIEWTDRTWNPVTGCTKVSTGCKHCYAETIANRKLPGGGFTDRPFTEVRTHADRLRQPLTWRKPGRVFVNSMSDLFHEAVPDAFLDQVFAVMACASRQTFQVLTKRPERMAAYLTSRARSAQYWKDAARTVGYALEWEGFSLVPFPLPNVWLGVSVENQEQADARIPVLLGTPAAVRFVSAEPLLGPLDLAPFFDGVLTDFSKRDYPLHWVIVGGESGPGARPCDIAWVRGIVRQCQAAAVPVFVKQLGASAEIPQGCGDCDPCLGGGRCYQQYNIRADFKDRKGGDLAEWPADLRVRELPRVTG